MQYLKLVNCVAVVCIFLFFLDSTMATPLGPTVKVPSLSSAAKTSATKTSFASKSMTPKQLRLERIKNNPKAKLLRADAIKLPDRADIIKSIKF
uniref:Hypothetical secreted protein n=1 Tax=Simulium nigrimanum TaxID=683695 RepID=D1FPY7_SIMNI